jgi:Homeodomain-like domain
MCDTSRGELTLPLGRTRPGGGHGSQGGDHDRAPAGSAPRAPADRGDRGRGVPAPGDLPAELLPVQTALRGRGTEGLEARSRRPLGSPWQIDVDLEVEICRMRKDHPRWGARRIRAELRRSGVGPPAVSTIHRVLRRNHLVARPAPETPQDHQAVGPQRPVADRRHQDPSPRRRGGLDRRRLGRPRPVPACRPSV